VTVLVLILLSIVIPMLIMRPFSGLQKIMVLLIIFCQLSAMYTWHSLLIRDTGLPVIIDVHKDAQNYYTRTESFSGRAPFSVTIREAREASGGTLFFGYHYLLAVFWTISSTPMLALRFFKILFFFIGLSCLTRVWRSNYGSKLAFLGFVVLGVFCTTEFYYNFRNLKDGFLFSLFMIAMAILDTIFQPTKNKLYSRTISVNIFLWVVCLAVLFSIATIRFYLTAIIIVAIVMHLIIKSDIHFKVRIVGLVVLAITTVFVFKSKFVLNTMEQGEIAMSGGFFSFYSLFQTFFSPIPWGPYIEKSIAAFHYIYLIFLPYVLFVFFKHFKSNIDWHLFLYLMIIFVIAVVTSDPPRKRLVIYPIMLVWILKNLAWNAELKTRAISQECDS